MVVQVHLTLGMMDYGDHLIVAVQTVLISLMRHGGWELDELQ